MPSADPEAERLLSELDAALPGLRAYLEAHPHENADSAHGVASAATHYVWDPQRKIPRESWQRVAEVVNEAVGDSSEVDNALCTCFLENLASRRHPLRAYLRGAALEFWQAWEV